MDHNLSLNDGTNDSLQTVLFKAAKLMTHPSWLKTLPTFTQSRDSVSRFLSMCLLMTAAPDPVEERLGYDVEVFGGQESEKGGTVVAHSTKEFFNIPHPGFIGRR